MKSIHKPLPNHSLPKDIESLAIWIDFLAKSNSISFYDLLQYLSRLLTIEKDLYFTLGQITNKSEDLLNNLKNEFKDHFWKLNRECPIKKCDFKTSRSNSLKLHLEYKHNLGVKLLKCPECDYNAKRRSDLNKHIKAQHSDKKEWFKCKYCDYKTYDKGNMRKHVQYKHRQDNQIKCKYCSYSTNNPQNLNRHINSKHSSQTQIFHCKQCTFNSKRKDILKQHVEEVHDNIRRFKCPKCEYIAKRRYRLKLHLEKIHNYDINHLNDN